MTKVDIAIFPLKLAHSVSSGSLFPANFDERHHVDAATGQRQSAIGRRCHIADDAAARRDGPPLERFGFRIESHQHVRRSRRLGVPDDIVDRRNRVRSGFSAAGGRPFGDLAGCGIHSADIASRIIRIPNEIVAGHRDPPRPRLRIRQDKFRDLHCFGIDTPDLVRAEFGEEWRALGIHHQAIGKRICGRRRYKLDLARRRSETPDHISADDGEPQRPLLIEDRRVRVASLRIGKRKFSDVAVFGIEFADVTFETRREPDIAAGVGDEPVRTRVRGFQTEFPKLPGLRG